MADSCIRDLLYALRHTRRYLGYRVFGILQAKDRLKGELLAKIESGEINREETKGAAHTATHLLLPDCHTSDIDYNVSYGLFACFPCLLPVSEGELSDIGATASNSNTMML